MRQIEEGKIRARSDALKHCFITPGWKWVDPEKELKAHLGAVDAGLTTLSDVAMQQGADFEELVLKRKRELELIREAGLPEVRSTLTRDVTEAPADRQGSQPADDDDEFEDDDNGD